MTMTMTTSTVSQVIVMVTSHSKEKKWKKHLNKKWNALLRR